MRGIFEGGEKPGSEWEGSAERNRNHFRKRNGMAVLSHCPESLVDSTLHAYPVDESVAHGEAEAVAGIAVDDLGGLTADAID